MTSGAKRTLLWGLVAAVIAAGLVMALRDRPVPIDSALVDRGTVIVTLNEEGRTRVRDIYTLSAPIAGTLERIEAEAGDAVVARVSVLAAIRPTEPTLLDAREEARVRAEIAAARANLDLARAVVERVHADIRFAENELERARTLVETSVASERTFDLALTEWERAQAALRTAEAQVVARAAELDRALAELMQATDAADHGQEGCCVHVISPISGHVLRVIHENEGVVAAGEPLIELGALDAMEVLVEALSTEAVSVRPGAPVAIERWGGGRELNGRVRRVEPYGFTKVSALGIEEQRVNILIDFEDPAEAATLLGHGYRVETRTEVARSEDAVRAPLAALFRTNDSWTVFVVRDGRATLQPVDVGLINDRVVEINGGLSPGDAVILRPDTRIATGVAVVERDD